MNETYEEIRYAADVITHYCSLVEKAEDNENTANRKLRNYKKIRNGTLIGVVFINPGYLVGPSFFKIAEKFEWIANGNESIIKIINLTTGLISIFAGAIICWLVLSAIRNVVKKTNNSLLREAEQLRGEADELYNREYNNFSFIPEDYRNTVSVNYIAKLFRDNRVDTIREALVLCDEFIHRNNVENAQQQIINEQEHQIRQLRSIKVNTGVSAAANVTNTAFNIMNNLFKR